MSITPSGNEPRKPVLLIVEEEAGVRGLLELALGGSGFNVLTAANGWEAIEIFKKEAQAIDLVLMDVRMHGLDGRGTLDHLRQIKPGVRCCFMSGDTASGREQELRDRGGLCLFRKPFPSLAELARSLRELVKETP